MIDDLLTPFVSFVKERHIILRTYYRLQGLSVSADPKYLHRVLTNLLANAVKFTPDGGIISLYVARVVDYEGKVQLYLSVSDTGCGIPEKDLPKILIAFSSTEFSGLSCLRADRYRHRFEYLQADYCASWRSDICPK